MSRAHHASAFEDGAQESVALSIVIARAGGPSCVRRCLESLAPQIQERPTEVIVPYESTEPEIGRLEMPSRKIRLLEVGKLQRTATVDALTELHEKHDYLLAKGLAAARGTILAIVEDTVIVAGDWCREILAAHQLPHGVIGGAVEHAGHSGINWAIYFLDFGRYQPPLREGAAGYLTDVNISYKREVLASVRPVWVESYNEVAVNWALARLGTVLWLRPQIVVWQDRGQVHFSRAVRERVAWGRIFARQRCREISLARRVLYLVACPVLPVLLIGRVASKVVGSRRNRRHFLRAFPYLVVLASAWCVGEVLSYVTAPGPVLAAERLHQ
jgi:hypothetical protein